ncbi:CFA44 protein, partial [Eulacestoma nigropectus]|nr:CFA44 protein [Eulacestoma nigropectus]
MQDGSLRAYPLRGKDLSVDALKDYWYLNVHDNDYGQIRGICCSHDDRCLITCGGDGNIFTFDIWSEEELPEELPEEVPKELKVIIPPPRSGLEKEKATEDIKDPDAYTIEEYKQKKEFERKMEEAEEKKNKKREELRALRHDFVFLLQKNLELPKHMQLHREEFEMDRRIFEELDRQRLQRIQLVQKELAWEHEKQLIGLQKLQTQFRDSLEFTLIVHAIQSNHQISTYSLLTVSEKYAPDKKHGDSKWAVLKEKWTALKQAERAEEVKIPRETSSVRRESVVFESEAEKLETPEDRKPTTRYIESKREKIRRIVEKYDALKAKIMKRRAEWHELYKSKPRDNYENSEDAEEIKEERANIGCYRLKTATNYTLTEHERMNSQKKMMQLASLEGLIRKMKINMNKEILSLRDLKVSIIDEIKGLVKELKSIQASLDLSEHLPIPVIPQLHPDEVPEKVIEYNSDVLLKFKEEQEAKAELKEPQEGCPSSRAFRHMFLRTPPVEEGDPRAQAGDASAVVTEEQKAFEMEKAEPTEMELEILKREKIKNLYLQETLIKKINTLVINFDAELCLLRHKKLKMDMQMKSADLRCITCCDELIILKKLEVHENLLEEQICALINEQEDIQSKLKSCLAQMEDRKCEIVMLQEREKALYASFEASLGENNEFADFLTDILKKEVEFVEKKVEREADEENENKEEDGEKTDLKTDGVNCGSEDVAFDGSVCPEGCSEDLFLNTIQLQQQRIGIEKALEEEKKVAADLKKEYNALAKKEKEVETSLDTTNRELEAFQWEKLQKLNELYVVVPLRLHQVQCLVDGEMPRDFSQTLVFTNQSLQYLQKRIVDLRNEKIMQREIHKKAREQHKQLLQDKKEMEAEIQRLEERCNHLMMEKFGRLVDFEAVQAHSVNIPMEKMKVRIMEKEYEHFVELREWEERIVVLQHQLMKLTRENTSKLHQLNRFCHEKHQLETELESLTADPGGDLQDSQTTDIKERARLESRLIHMTRDVVLLRKEIN